MDVTSGTLEILNRRCEEIPSKEVMPLGDWKMVTNAYEKAEPGVPLTGKKKVRFSPHCEITLALEMLQRCGQRQLSKNRIEIGVSKACCSWCIDYLDLLAREFPKKHPLLLRASHGKQPDGWLMPPNGPKTTAKQMTKLIVGRIDNVVWKIRSRRRSDSNELPAEILGGSDPDFEAMKQRGFINIKFK
jgi:nucleic acid/nucleotide deaminase of polymorphic system toxin